MLLTKIVLSVARPSVPPTCCIVLSTAEATEESSWATPWTAVRVSGTKIRPRPKARTTIHGSRSEAYVLCGVRWVKPHMPSVAKPAPAPEIQRGSTLAMRNDATCAATTMPTENGRNARPVLSGE